MKGTETCSKRCSSAPSSNMGMRLLPECGVGTLDRPIDEGSIESVPLSMVSTFAPIEVSISFVMVTSPMGGTFVSMVGVSASSAATIAFVVKFFAPRQRISPTTGLPPVMLYAYLCDSAIAVLSWNEPEIGNRGYVIDGG